MNEDLLVLLPAENCVICDRPHAEIGGERLTVSHGGVRVADEPVAQEGRRSIELDNGRYLIVWGRIRDDPEVLERAIMQARSDRHPWQCQRCTGRVCRACGSLYRLTPGADLIHDDGRKGHMMAAPISRLCSNPHCSET